MYRNKKDVDKHVESLLYKLSEKDFNIRAYSIARLYYDVGDYGSCQKYVEQYLSLKSNNAAAHKLLGSACQKLGDKEKALEQYITSLGIDPSQTATILDVCELLTDTDVTMEIGRAKYWCEKAEAVFPKHPITFRLKERLLSEANPDPEALENLLKSELVVRPKDAILHARLLKHFLHTNQIREACDHSCNVEFDQGYFSNNYAWYETLTGILKYNPLNTNDWMYQLLLLTVKEKLCHLSLSEIPNSASKNLMECNSHLFEYDQSIQSVSKAGPAPGFGEFHTNLLQHHRGQLAFHAATFLLKKANKDQINWNEAVKYSAPLMLIAYQTVPMDPKKNWLSHAPNHQQKAVHQWQLDGSYRCSQSGHYILANVHAINYFHLDQISQLCSGTHWRDKLFEKIFPGRNYLSKIESSSIASASFVKPSTRLPQKFEVEAYDGNAQRVYPNSLHHFVWMLLNYKEIADFTCTLFDMLTSSTTGCGPETLSKIDVLAFLYCATLTAINRKKDYSNHISKEKPIILPANITQLLCTLPQMKWWDCAYKLSQSELGTEYTDIRSTLSRGIEIVRCIDNHGLDPELLCFLGRIFRTLANTSALAEEKKYFKERALLYYSAAVPLLENIKSKTLGKPNNRRMFEYVHKSLDTKESNILLDESKVYVAISHLDEGDYDKVIELLSNLRSPQAYYYLGVAFKRIALDEKKNSQNSDKESKYFLMLSKAKQFAYKGLHKIKETDQYQATTLYTDIQTLIEETEILFNKTDLDMSSSTIHDNESKYSSDDNEPMAYGEPVVLTQTKPYRNVSSTPKHTLKHTINLENYRTAIDSQILNNSTMDVSHVERIEKQVKSLQKRDSTISDFMEQTKEWFQENRKLGNQIISTINSNIENTTEQFKLLRVSVGQVKEQIDECRNECKDVADLKKEIAELKKEVNKLKKSTSEQTSDDNELYNLEEEYRTNENPSAFGTQIPFAPQQVIPPFTQRLVPPFSVPPNPYQLYGQNFYNLYNQFSQFSQTPAVPGAQQIFDPTRTQMNYPSVYTNPDQIYLDAAHLVPPNLTVAPPIQTVHTTANPSIPLSVAPPTVTLSTTKNYAMELKDMGKSLPVNVVITTSDPLPSSTSAPQPVLSVTIPPKQIKNSPHNYQIAMPGTNDMKISKPPVYTSPSTEKQSSQIPAPVTVSSSYQTSQPKQTVINLGNIDLKQSLEKPTTTGFESVFSASSPNTSLNKSRTLSEKSNTSIENYDPCPDFKPIVPLPAEVVVTTGEEDEAIIFKARAKLFRFTDKQWKERGIGDLKLLKHAVTGKVRVLMRREQVHKICANHIILPEMEIKPMKNETKAYFWVANDFAEQTVILEKFCIRFKTVDIAKDFYDAFEKARQEAITNVTNTSVTVGVTDTCKTDLVQSSTPLKKNSDTAGASKIIAGGFTFSSTPTFKTQDNVQDTVISTSGQEAKVNVFSTLSFKTNNTSFQNVFNVASDNKETINLLNTSGSNSSTKLNSSDVVEEYEPNVEFQPVVPLPALVDQKTGEEDEIVLFEHRAKLLRFDVTTKEWKERGLGNIKLLEHKDNKKIRLLMRREQIMKICCNHTVTKEMTFLKKPNMDKAVTWCAKDFSDGELIGETFCLRFKNVQTCDDFMAAVRNAQSKTGDGTKAAKEEENAAKVAASSCELHKSQDSTNNTNMSISNWGNKFKPKPNSWECNVCLIRNDVKSDICSACNNPKHPKMGQESAVNENAPKFSFGTKQNTDKLESAQNVTSNWGDKYKPKPNTWECNMCLIRSDDSNDICSACNNPKDPKNVEKPIGNENTTNFSFGIKQNTEKVEFTQNVTSKWGDKFKPKEGTWECQLCFVRNEGSMDVCNACNGPKDPFNTANKEVKLLFSSPCAPKFSFGIPQNNASDAKTAPLFSAPTNKTFSFGIPQMGQEKLNIAQNKSKEPLNDKKLDKDTTSKPPLLETPKAIPPFGEIRGAAFDFAFTPKTSLKVKSPLKTPTNEKGDDNSDNEYASEDEGHHIHFSPVILVPDKIKVVTGEEDEDELYAHRAKLYIFSSGEWKERGIGIVKILKHKITSKLRVLMRREQVFKICLNHSLTSEIIYKEKDEKTWIFAANDFSDEELVISQFCLRFGNKDIAQEFKSAVERALSNKTDAQPSVKDETNRQDTDDVQFISEINATTEEKQKARELMLPENFYTYKNKLPCQGCRGCDDTEKQVPPKHIPSTPKAIVASTLSKISATTFQSPANSFYGTPTSLQDKTMDTTNYRTPLNSTFANSETSTTSTSSYNSIDEYDKENTLDEVTSSDTTLLGTDKKDFDNKSLFSLPQPTLVKTSVFNENKSLFTGNKSLFSTQPQAPVGENKSLFSTQPQAPVGENKSILGDSKPIFGEGKPILAESKSIFGENKSLFGESKPVFGESKPIFGEAKPIFGESKPIFGESKPIFGESKAIFGESKPIFGDSKSIFGKSNPLFGETKHVPAENKSIFAGNKPLFAENKSIFGENKPIFVEKTASLGPNKTTSEGKPVFGENKTIFGETKSIFGDAKSVLGDTKSTFGETKPVFGDSKSVFGGTKSIFGENKPDFGENKSIFGEKKSVFGENKSIFGTGTSSNKSIFGNKNSDGKEDSGSIRTENVSSTSSSTSILGSAPRESVFSVTPSNNENKLTSGKSIFGTINQFSFGNATQDQSSIQTTISTPPKTGNDTTATSKGANMSETKDPEEKETPFKIDNNLSFAVLSNSSEEFEARKTANFKWEGAGQPLFGAGQNRGKTGDKSKNDSNAGDEATGPDEAYDPYYEPIVPLPDKIVVTTGEEDEEKLFDEYCKLFRFDDKTKEWKERGVGELKILYHPERKTFRLLMRREQVHKLVLNMLLYVDFELLPMKKSGKAWTWVGTNFAEGAVGEQETLAVRFGTSVLANKFNDKIQECVRKLQVAAAEAIRKDQEAKEIKIQAVTPLRLPKHLESTARADDAIAAKILQSSLSQPNTVQTSAGDSSENVQAQVAFSESQGQEQYEYDTEYQDYENNENEYDHNEDSDGYYNEEDEEGDTYYFGRAELIKNGVESVCEESHIEVTYDQDAGVPKVIITDANTGEVLADMRIEADTEFTLSNDVCAWTGTDYTTNTPVDTTARISFGDSDKAIEFYDFCETSKAGIYSVEHES